MKKFFRHNLKVLSLFALFVAAISANTTCSLWIHQPELPESVKALRKF